MKAVYKNLCILNLEPWIRPKQKRTQNYVQSYEYESIFEKGGLYYLLYTWMFGYSAEPLKTKVLFSMTK